MIAATATRGAGIPSTAPADRAASRRALGLGTSDLPLHACDCSSTEVAERDIPHEPVAFVVHLEADRDAERAIELGIDSERLRNSIEAVKNSR